MSFHRLIRTLRKQRNKGTDIAKLGECGRCHARAEVSPYYSAWVCNRCANEMEKAALEDDYHHVPGE